jgi:hypothetical protein
VQLEPSRGRGEVQTFLEADEGHAALMELLNGRDDVRQAPAEAVETPNADRVELAPAGLRHQAIERRPAVFAAGDAFVAELAGDGPLPAGDIAAELEELVVDGLGIGTDTAVNRGTHDGSPQGRGSHRIVGSPGDR